MITALVRAPHLYHVFPRNYILYYCKCIQANAHCCACNCPPIWQFCGLVRSYQPFQIFVNLHCVTYIIETSASVFVLGHRVVIHDTTFCMNVKSWILCWFALWHWQVHVHLSVFGLTWKALNREKCYLLPTWARKRTCQHFVWCIRSKRWQVIFRAQVGNR